MPHALAAGDLGFRFKAGWCDLTLAAEPTPLNLRATALNDSFGNLADAVARLTGKERETRLQAVLWGGEPGGVFLDFATLVPDHVSLVVHEMAARNWIAGTAMDWSPIRGRVLAVRTAPRPEFLAVFLDAFAAVAGLTGKDGLIEGWGHPYPQHAVTAIRASL